MFHVLRTALSGLRAQQFAIEVIGNNIANVDTPGFKSVSTHFSTHLGQTTSAGDAGGGVQVADTVADFRSGPPEITGVPSDLAIQGDGFFVLQDGNGQRAYTRDGSFALNAAGLLHDPATGMLVQGYAAGGEPQITPSVLTNVSLGNSAHAGATGEHAVLRDYTVGRDGTITGVFSNGVSRSIAQVALATFANSNGLSAVGGNFYRPTASSGSARTGVAGTRSRGTLLGGAIEGSNVDLADEFVGLIIAQRAFQANARVIQLADELLEELINLI